MRTENLDPIVQADLEELERALAGEPSRFTELVADVRAERPQMRPSSPRSSMRASTRRARRRKRPVMARLVARGRRRSRPS